VRRLREGKKPKQKKGGPGQNLIWARGDGSDFWKGGNNRIVRNSKKRWPSGSKEIFKSSAEKTYKERKIRTVHALNCQGRVGGFHQNKQKRGLDIFILAPRTPRISEGGVTKPADFGKGGGGWEGGRSREGRHGTCA